ncbi:MAG: HhoA/HhoB/HtrA family serine endopeptidase [Prochloraceae cyanobacterium]|nr:HhoA/HhoB/HtrA family serine endopeptidase [Prochloraceae cyanobacterium]
MKPRKFFRNLSSHIVALVLGGVVVFVGIQGLSQQTQISALADETNSYNTQVSRAIPIDGQESFVARAVALTGPAVVRIDTEKIIRSNTVNPFDNDPFFRDFFGDREFRNRQPERRVDGIGSGFIIDKSGIILTNAHVVDAADSVKVTLKDGRVFQGEVRGTDRITDLAVVKINPTGQDLPIAPLGDSSALEVGDWAIAVGNPVGLNNTVTLGIISTLDRSSAQAGVPDKRIDFLQTDAAINPGNSGGPLLNAKGEVIGINTAIRTDAMGIGFAIPINKAKSLKDTLASGREVPHPFVGIQMVDLTSELARKQNQDPNSAFLLPEIDGVLVVGVVPNMPAEKAGIRRGDVIVQINNQRVTKSTQIQRLVERSGVNQALRFKIRRGDNTLNLSLRTAQLQADS